MPEGINPYNSPESSADPKEAQTINRALGLFAILVGPMMIVWGLIGAAVYIISALLIWNNGEAEVAPLTIFVNGCFYLLQYFVTGILLLITWKQNKRSGKKTIHFLVFAILYFGLLWVVWTLCLGNAFNKHHM